MNNEVRSVEDVTKPHVRLHITPCGWWWSEHYLDYKHGWNISGHASSPRRALQMQENGEVTNRRGYLAQWPNQVRARP